MHQKENKIPMIIISRMWLLQGLILETIISYRQQIEPTDGVESEMNKYADRVTECNIQRI